MVTTINIKGMDCGACLSKVDTALRGMQGVSDVAVSLENASATIQYDEKKVAINDLNNIIEELGFEVA